MTWKRHKNSWKDEAVKLKDTTACRALGGEV